MYCFPILQALKACITDGNVIYHGCHHSPTVSPAILFLKIWHGPWIG